MFKKLVLCEPQNFEGLFFGNKPTLNSEALVRYLLSALISELFRVRLEALLIEESSDLFKPLSFCEWTYHALLA